MSLTDLKNRSRVVRDETQLKANTANRVGQILMDAVDYLITLVGLSHSHTNKNVLDELGENSQQKLTYRGQVIETSSDITVSTWIDPPIIKIIDTLPDPLVEGDRYAVTITGAIYEVISGAWVIDPSTNPIPAEASAVIVRFDSDDNEVNAIHIFENGTWVNKNSEFNFDESRFVTAHDTVNGRKLIPFTGSPNDITETGFFYGADNSIGNPLYQFLGTPQTDMVYYIHQNHNVDNAYQLAFRTTGGNQIWFRIKDGGWCSWSVLNIPADDDTIVIEGGEYVVKKLKDQTVSITEINYLFGVTSNIQSQINALSSVGNFTGTSPDFASITTLFPTPNDRDLVIVLEDEDYSDLTTIYIYSSTTTDWEYSGQLTNSFRDFSINPIDLESEVTGVLPETNIDVLIARTADIDQSKWEENLGIITPKGNARVRTPLLAVNNADVVNKEFLDGQLTLKVDKEVGKGLSTNDYTTVEKNKVADLSGVNTGDQFADQVTIIGSGSALDPFVAVGGGGGGGYEPKNSIEVDAGELQLVGDSATPGNNKYYGTDVTGDKGFHNLPSGEHNTIDSISLDGATLTPDIDKNVEITLDDKYVSLDQTTKQTLTKSPIFGNLTSGQMLYVDEDKSLKSADGLTYDPTTKKININAPITSPNYPIAPIMFGDGNIINNSIFDQFGNNFASFSRQANSLSIANIVASNTPTQRPVQKFVRSRGALNSPLSVQNGDWIGDFLFAGYTGSGHPIINPSGLFAYVDGKVSPGVCPITISIKTGSTSNRVDRLTVKPDGKVGISTTLPKKGLEVGSTAGYVSSVDEGTGDTDFASRKTAKTFGKQSLTTKAPVVTVWASSDYRDGQIKTTKAEYYNETALYYEQRFDWNEDFSVKCIEIKDDITGLWVQRNYTWTDGIPSVSETIITTAWTI
jgi:hypothetical protein